MRIALDLHRRIDLDALEHGHPLFAYRCFAHLRFRLPNGWSGDLVAIVDTGAPFSVIPATVWKPLQVTSLFPSALRGIIPNTTAMIPARLATVHAVVTDERHVSPELELTALLADEPDVPLLLGWSGCFDRATLTIDGAQQRASLDF